MADACILVDQDQFLCLVCLDLLNDPLTVPCGHSYCKVCIHRCWDQEDWIGVYSCPLCKDTFTPRPVLRRNNLLAEVVEKVKKTKSPPAHCYAGPGDVECDFCTRRKLKAIKSCLVCVASFCKDHLKPHLERSSLKVHTLIEASGNLQARICCEHNKLLEIFCRTDQKPICSLCTIEKHKGHDTVPVTAERHKRQRVLNEEQMKFQQRIQEKQKKIQELKQTVNIIKFSAQTAVKDSEMMFTEMISFLEKKRGEVTELIRVQETTELNRTERLLNLLEQEITDLQKRLTELEQLSHTRDHIHFLQTSASGPQSPCSDFNISVPQHLSFNSVRNSVSDLTKKLVEVCEKEFSKISPHAAAVQTILPLEPQSSVEFLMYFSDLTLDPVTAHPVLHLSQENKLVRCIEKLQSYPDHPARFDCWY